MAKKIEVCVWERYSGKYVTSCGHQAHAMGRGWNFCPFCGKYYELSKKKYQTEYHKKHKEEHAEYYKEYYQKNKV
jgi:hypothetical protein